MRTEMKRKMYMGIWRFMLPLPLAISAKGMQRGVSGAKTKADLLTQEERKVHHFIVKQMAIAKEHITVEFIGEKLNLSLNRVKEIVEKLEAMKTFCYRYDSQGINWAYPLAFEDTGHKMTAGTGEQFFAAWAADAIATPFVYGRLQNEELFFTVNSKCANSGKPMKIELDSNLNIISVDEGSEPMFCVALMNTDKTKEPSIVDIFWRKSLFFWSEEDAREYQKKTRKLKFYMNLNAISLKSIKQIQSAIFGFSEDEWLENKRANCTASAVPASSLSERSGDLSAFGGSRSAGLQGALINRLTENFIAWGRPGSSLAKVALLACRGPETSIKFFSLLKSAHIFRK